MKYPLTIVKRLLDHYGRDIGLGYDIMCAFFKTLLRSSLGKHIVAMNLRRVVPAFHGHAHNRACQVGWHPLYVDGVGLKDFEECERTFCKSNHLATVTRLSTAFHRRRQIDEHFSFHDLHKHTASGNFIYQNYRQALEKIRINRDRLDAVEQRIGTTAQDYKSDLKSEQVYFRGLRTEPPEVSSTVEYMELLCKQESDEAGQDFRSLDYNIINNRYTRTEITHVRTRYQTTHNKYVITIDEVCRHEEEKNIEVHWELTLQVFKDALVMMTKRCYRRALDELKHLVVQHLFEMTKLGMSGVGTSSFTYLILF
ncbi:hypothetical protein B0H17DRAFT_957727 [Mycena rosella]|uniref:Uncharacterized protein n=1 Tax=Mycena rosella TaxID=1033263 RepID=A0AAD7G2K6_MYCRO|nr:hypothetical protein B0H17DRAFT_957727 [Mycena rosella]